MAVFRRSSTNELSGVDDQGSRLAHMEDAVWLDGMAGKLRHKEHQILDSVRMDCGTEREVLGVNA